MRTWDDETMGFHEAIADITTLLYSLEYDSSIREMIKETCGNLRLPNRMAQRPEEIGLARGLCKANTLHSPSVSKLLFHFIYLGLHLSVSPEFKILRFNLDYDIIWIVRSLEHGSKIVDPELLLQSRIL